MPEFVLEQVGSSAGILLLLRNQADEHPVPGILVEVGVLL
jgi:hypothetical protein